MYIVFLHSERQIKQAVKNIIDLYFCLKRYIIRKFLKYVLPRESEREELNVKALLINIELCTDVQRRDV